MKLSEALQVGHSLVWKAGWAPTLVFCLHIYISQVLNGYVLFPPMDIPVHFLGGVAMAYFLSQCFAALPDGIIPLPYRKTAESLTVVSLTATAAVIWEFAEFLSDTYFGTRAQLGINDTLLDLALGIVGALFYVGAARLRKPLGETVLSGRLIFIAMAIPGVLCGQALLALLSGAKWPFIFQLLCAATVLTIEIFIILAWRTGFQLLSVFLSMFGFAATSFVVLAMAFGNYTPDLTFDQAAAIIESSPEFRRHGSPLVVAGMGIGDQSGCGDPCYTGTVFFTPSNGPAIPIKASFMLQYRNGAWRLKYFRYGMYPNVQWVELE